MTDEGKKVSFGRLDQTALSLKQLSALACHWHEKSDLLNKSFLVMGSNLNDGYTNMTQSETDFQSFTAKDISAATENYK